MAWYLYLVTPREKAKSFSRTEPVETLRKGRNGKFKGKLLEPQPAKKKTPRAKVEDGSGFKIEGRLPVAYQRICMGPASSR